MLASLLFLIQSATPKEIHVTVDGIDRLAYAMAPSKPSAKPPVLLMFHGHGGSAERCMVRFSVEKRWPEAVVVYCDGLPIRTGGGMGKGWELDTIEQNRDIRFVDALLPKVLSRFHAMPRRFLRGASQTAECLCTRYGRYGRINSPHFVRQALVS